MFELLNYFDVDVVVKNEIGHLKNTLCCREKIFCSKCLYTFFNCWTIVKLNINLSHLNTLQVEMYKEVETLFGVFVLGEILNNG